MMQDTNIPQQNQPFPVDDQGAAGTYNYVPNAATQDPSAPSTQISVSSGTPESAPIPVSTESPAENIEFGYEKLKQIENTREELDKIENKETRQQQDPLEQQIEPRKPEMPVSAPPKPMGPKVFGYFIPPAITSNIQNIRQNKGSGDTRDAKTWIYVLLDRLLKKQTYQRQEG